MGWIFFSVAKFFCRTGRKVFQEMATLKLWLNWCLLSALSQPLLALSQPLLFFMASLQSHSRTSSVYDILRSLQVQSLQAISLPLWALFTGTTKKRLLHTHEFYTALSKLLIYFWINFCNFCNFFHGYEISTDFRRYFVPILSLVRTILYGHISNSCTFVTLSYSSEINAVLCSQRFLCPWKKHRDMSCPCSWLQQPTADQNGSLTNFFLNLNLLGPVWKSSANYDGCLEHFKF